MPTLRSVQAIGRTARDALVASGGRVDADAFGTTRYARAKDEVIFFGDVSTAMHPRIVILEETGRFVHGDCVDVDATTPWEPSHSRTTTLIVDALGLAIRALQQHLAIVRPLQGFAMLLMGEVPPFPLDRATDLVRAFARAIEADDMQAIRRAALPLLGLGPGLTPSGDDLVGAALFARRLLTRSSACAPNSTLADELVAVARKTSHPIAAALFADLVTGDTFAPLHELAIACAERDDTRVRSAIHALVRIGSSSGYDMLAGFIIGIGGSAVLPRFGDNG